MYFQKDKITLTICLWRRSSRKHICSSGPIKKKKNQWPRAIWVHKLWIYKAQTTRWSWQILYFRSWPSTKKLESEPANDTLQPMLRAAIFNHCARANWCARNGSQMWHRNLGKGHLILGSMGMWVVKNLVVVFTTLVHFQCAMKLKRSKITGLENRVAPRM